MTGPVFFWVRIHPYLCSKDIIMAILFTVLSDKMFTSEFSELKCVCDAESMSFAIRQGGTEILSQTYFPDENHLVTIYDLDRFLESCISDLCATFSFLLDGKLIKDVTVFACRAAITEKAGAFYTDYFFTASMGERDTAPGRFEVVTMYCDTETEVTARCSYLTAEGTVVEKVKQVASFTGWSYIDVSPSKFIDEAAGQLISYVVEAGARKARFRVLMNAPEADPAFFFRNSFGCWETIYLTGAKQVTPSYSRSTALIGGKTLMYDISETLAFKARTGPLRPGSVPVALDLARSMEVYLLDQDGKTGERVTITDVDVKHTNEDDSIPDFTFTYRRADRRSVQISVTRPPRVFDKTFDKTYE